MPAGVKSLINRFEGQPTSQDAPGPSTRPYHEQPQATRLDSVTESNSQDQVGDDSKQHAIHASQQPILSKVAQEKQINGLFGFGWKKPIDLQRGQEEGNPCPQLYVGMNVTSPGTTKGAKSLKILCAEALWGPSDNTVLLCKTSVVKRACTQKLIQVEAPQRQISIKSLEAEQFYHSSLSKKTSSTDSLNTARRTLSLDEQLDDMIESLIPPRATSDHESHSPAPSHSSLLGYYVATGARSPQRCTPAPVFDPYTSPQPSSEYSMSSGNTPMSLTPSPAAIPPAPPLPTRFTRKSSSRKDTSPPPPPLPPRTHPSPSVVRSHTVLSDFSFNKPLSLTPFSTPHAPQTCPYCPEATNIRRIPGSQIESKQRSARAVAGEAARRNARYERGYDSLRVMTGGSRVGLREGEGGCGARVPWGVPVRRLYDVEGVWGRDVRGYYGDDVECGGREEMLNLGDEGPLDYLTDDEPVHYVLGSEQMEQPPQPSSHARCKWWKRLFCARCRRDKRSPVSNTLAASAHSSAVIEVLCGEKPDIDAHGEEDAVVGEKKKKSWWRSETSCKQRKKLRKRGTPCDAGR